MVSCSRLSSRSQGSVPWCQACTLQVWPAVLVRYYEYYSLFSIGLTTNLVTKWPKVTPLLWLKADTGIKWLPIWHFFLFFTAGMSKIRCLVQVFKFNRPTADYAIINNMQPVNGWMIDIVSYLNKYIVKVYNCIIWLWSPFCGLHLLCFDVDKLIFFLVVALTVEKTGTILWNARYGEEKYCFQPVFTLKQY